MIAVGVRIGKKSREGKPRMDGLRPFIFTGKLLTTVSSTDDRVEESPGSMDYSFFLSDYSAPPCLRCKTQNKGRLSAGFEERIRKL